MEEQLHCSVCNFLLEKEFNFCPNCGKKVHEPAQSTGIGRQFIVYLVSIFLPPLGLWPAIKYIRQKEMKAKIIGWVAVVLTVISTFASIWFSIAIVDQYSKVLDTQMKTYQQLGL